MLGLTIFKNIYDNKTNKKLKFESVMHFEKFLFKAAQTKYKEKSDAVLMNPASFEDNTTRRNDNVIEWQGWAAVDIDDHVFEGDLKSELENKYGKYRYVCYSTASSTKEHPKFRLVFPLKHNVPANKIKHFWYALNKELGDIGDPQTKDLSRMYYVPGTYTGANNFIFANLGDIMDPSTVMLSWPYVERSTNNFMENLPPAIREQLINYKKDQMTNTSISWNSYRDCPFVNKKLVSEYKTISDTGWYRHMYRIMVSTAMNALKQKYPITSDEIAIMCQQLDSETGNWYKNRPLKREAEGAIKFAYENSVDFMG